MLSQAQVNLWRQSEQLQDALQWLLTAVVVSGSLSGSSTERLTFNCTKSGR